MREITLERSSSFADAPNLKPVKVLTEADKLHAYQKAISMLDMDAQNKKMNAVHSPKTLQRFLSAEAPNNLVARFCHRINELNQNSLTPEERSRIAEIELGIQNTLTKYLNMVNETDVDEQNLVMLIVQIHQGKTKLNVALGLIQENYGDEESAKITYRNAIEAGHMEGYSMLVRHHIRNEDFTSAYDLAIEALKKGFDMPAMDLAFNYLTYPTEGSSSEMCVRNILREVNPNDRRDPLVIIMDHAIRTGNFDRIQELIRFQGSLDEDFGLFVASSLLYEAETEAAMEHFIAALELQSCDSTIQKLRNIVANRDNPQSLNLHHARIFMAEHLRFILHDYGLNKIGNHLVNQTMN